MSWSYSIIGISVLIAAVLCYQEYGRNNKARLWLRLLSVCVTIAALACIVLPVSYRGTARQNQHEAVLLTPGFDKNQLNQFKDVKTFTADSSIHQQYTTARLVNNMEDMLLTDSAITALHILGDGLPAAQLAQLGHLPVTFNPSKAKTGLQNISWNGQLQAGDELRVQGQFLNALPANVNITLKGLNTGLDSLTVAKGAILNFELNTTPKHEGRTVYHLLVTSANDTIEKQSLPVEITPFKPLRLLVLSASPDFETRFLKNWLALKGYTAVVRSAISKNKYSTTYINLAGQPVAQISAPLLQKFDVVMADLSVLKTLNAAESAALKQEVTQKGLGLLIRADSAGRQSTWAEAGFAVEKAATKAQVPISMAIRGKKALSAKLNTDAAYLVNTGPYQVLVNDGHGHALAGSSLQGSGKIVYTTLNNTYNWMLAGNEADYSALWSLLLTEAARKENAAEKFAVLTPTPTDGQKVQLQLQAAAAPEPINTGNVTVAAVQNAILPFEWDAQLWPATAGWQQVSQQGKAESWWYVWPKNAWGNINALKNRYQTQVYTQKHPLKGSVTKQIQAIVLVTVPKIYFYMLFLAAAVFLWVEHKLSE